jgi:hypothetical protein
MPTSASCLLVAASGSAPSASTVIREAIRDISMPSFATCGPLPRTATCRPLNSWPWQ